MNMVTRVNYLHQQSYRSWFARVLVLLLVFTSIPLGKQEVLSAASNGSIVYDFKQDMNAGIENTGWEIADMHPTLMLPNRVRNQNYGLQIQSGEIGQYIVFNIIVPKSTSYRIEFNGAGYGLGGIGAIHIDGVNIGTYNFFSADDRDDKGYETYGIIQLSSGVHQLTLEAAEIPLGGSLNMYPASLKLTPMETVTVLESIKYDFRQDMNSGINELGWEIADMHPDLMLPGRVRNQSYGLQIQSGKIGQYVIIDINVPEDSLYTVKFNGAGYGGGGIGSLYIDEFNVGSYNFFSDVEMNEKGQETYGVIELSRGIHQFKIEATEIPLGGSLNMYPAELELVKQPILEEITMKAENHEFIIGQRTAMKLRGTSIDSAYIEYDLNAFNDAIITFTSSNEAVASVDNNGVVTAKQVGQTTIAVTVDWGGVTKTASADITVTDQTLHLIAVSAAQSSLTIKETTNILVEGKLEDGTVIHMEGATIRYESLDPNVATVSSVGVVTAVNTGETRINVEATLGPVTVQGFVEITVTGAILEFFTAKLAETKLFVGDHRRIYIEGVMTDGSPIDLEQCTIEYSSSNPTIADVQDGKVIVQQPGSATIHVTLTLDDVVKTAEIPITAQVVSNSKTRQTYYTPAKISAARHNVNAYSWAGAMRDGAVVGAEKYLALGLDYLWEMVTTQDIPRSYAVNENKGSPISGNEINGYGNYPYKADPNMPWKLIDPSAKDAQGNNYVYPTNDFGKYYESGLDEQGIFRRELANSEFLVNELYPEKGPTWGVDDGYGWIDDQGNRYTFIAYYAHWYIWKGIVEESLNAFRDAYLFTGDQKYAHAGIILLDRIADVYPEMDSSQFAWDDGFLNSHGGTGMGKVIGSIWETSLARNFISAYDAFFNEIDDTEVIAFLSGKAEQYDLGVLKSSGTGIRRNIEDGILREIYPAVQSARIRGNNGMHQSTLAMAAVVLDHFPETKEWLDFTFQAGGLARNPWRVTGGNILVSMVNDVDRDGAGNEAAPQYNGLWLNDYMNVAEILDGYDFYPEVDLFSNVKFRKMFTAQYPLMMLDRYTPSIGDSGYAGNPGLNLNKTQMIQAFDKYRDPLFAQISYFLNHNRSTDLYGGIFSNNPELLGDEVQAVIDEYGPLQLNSSNLTGYGFTALRDGIRTTQGQVGYSYLFPNLNIAEQSVQTKVYDNVSAVQLEANEEGHSIAFSFSVDTAGEYEVALRPIRAQSYGIYNVYIDDQFVKEFDFYGFSNELDLLTVMELSEGEHSIKFVNSGKREESGNYKLAVTELQLNIVQEEEDMAGSVDTMRGLWMYYGLNSGHGHRDTLNLGLHAFGLDLAPDLGYPRFGDSFDVNRFEWVNNTVSHNTVVVDKGKQTSHVVGIPRHYEGEGKVKLIDVEAPNVYPDTSQYRRTSAMIQVDEANSYVVDFFRVSGGNDHHFSFHSMDADVTIEGVELVSQTDSDGQYIGSYAGVDVPFGKRADSVDGTGYMGSGFHWLKDVERSENVPQSFSVDWNVKDTWNIYGNGLGAETDVHLRMTMLTEFDDVALANGVPPDNKPGNPEKIKYFIGHRKGENLESLFASVIEPYKNSRFVSSIEKVTVKQDGVHADPNNVQAIKVILDSGRTDYIVYSLDTSTEYIVADTFRFKGFFGVYSEVNDEVVYQYIVDGTVFAPIESSDQIALPRIEGNVIDFTRDLSLQNFIDIDMDLMGVSIDDLVGKWIYIANDGIRNAVYEIKGVMPLTRGYRLDLGDTTLIRSFVDANDFDLGYVYDITEGAEFIIPLSKEKDYQTTERDAVRLEIVGIPATPKVGNHAQINVAAVYEDDTTMDVTDLSSFISNNPYVADVDESGLITFNEQGTTEISVAYGQLEQKIHLEVEAAASNVIPSVLNDDAHPQPDENGHVHITLNGTETSVALEQELLQQATQITIVQGEMVLMFSKEAIQQLLQQMASAETGASKKEPLLVSIRENEVDNELLAKASDKAHADLGTISAIYDIQLSHANGSVTLDSPLTVRTKIDPQADQSLLGVYFIGEDGALLYLGGQFSRDEVEVSIPYAGKVVVLSYDKSFDDVDPAYWAHGMLKRMAALHLIEGTSESTYEPLRAVTRAEFAAMLVRLLGLEAELSDVHFADVSTTDWYASAIAAAAKAGIVNGMEEGIFAPNRSITREEMVVMLVRAYNTVVNSPSAQVSGFTDREQTSDWARASLDKAAALGLISGRADNLFVPQGITNRAEGAQAIYNLLGLFNN
ncbi:S-layer homology domain-containing protein [Paenibacillus chungangensis]|uniref:S-layer homology domain-containing protein n=1 Tax=Paenibacillus chungangensis TaxID=696535 RepID=A0ABW3HLM8_9BACL